MRMGSVPTQGRTAVSRALRPFTDVLTAALSGGEDEITGAVQALDTRGLARLRNALRTIEMVADRHETRMRRNLS